MSLSTGNLQFNTDIITGLSISTGAAFQLVGGNTKERERLGVTPDLAGDDGKDDWYQTMRRVKGVWSNEAMLDGKHGD